MVISGGSDFLVHFGSLFAHHDVAAWVWQEGDGQLGKRTSWPVSSNDAMEVLASVELDDGGVVLTVTERDVSGEPDERSNDAAVIFYAAISFDDAAVTVNEGALSYTPDSIRAAILQFNERSLG
jgi:hypothetical protein